GGEERGAVLADVGDLAADARSLAVLGVAVGPRVIRGRRDQIAGSLAAAELVALVSEPREEGVVRFGDQAFGVDDEITKRRLHQEGESGFGAGETVRRHRGT